MVGNIVWWIVGVFFSLATLSSLTVNSAISFLSFLIATAVSLPPLYKFVSNKFGLRLSTGIKIAVLIAGFLIGGSFLPKSEFKPKQKTIVNTVAPSKKPTTKLSPKPTIVLYKVVKVIDGDTISININGKNEVVRLIGINSPETQDPRKPVECFGKEASEKAKEVLTGKSVKLENDPTQGDRDKYNRLLRYVFLENGTNFNKLMIEEGYAYEYTYNTPYKYQNEFKQAQKDAEANQKGLWAEGVCITPTIIPTSKPIFTLSPTIKQLNYIQPTQPPQAQTGGSYSCSGGCKKCYQMTTCEEARYYFNTCSCSALDGDKDGVPCETLCN